jgi:hypothetical protein
LAMQVLGKQWLMRLTWPLLVLLLAVYAVGTGFAAPQRAAQVQPARRQSQGQAAGQFLRAVLRADYAAAYRQLAPEVRQTVSLDRFEAAARPLWKSGQHRSREIELYKLGVRLGGGRASRLFYAFTFAADSSLKTPSALLEVTFRDTASRAILGFGVRNAKAPAVLRSPAAAKPRR